MGFLSMENSVFNFFAIPSQINFNGQCILYGSTEKKDTGFTMNPGGAANCNFVIYASVFCMIFYGLAMGLYNLYAVVRSRKDPQIG